MSINTDIMKRKTYQSTMDRREYKGKEDTKKVKGRPLLSEIDNIIADRQLSNELSRMDIDNV